MWRVLVAIAACGAPPHVAPREAAAPPVATSAKELPPERGWVNAPRIDVALLLPPRDLPWPLTEPPSVQPHLDVAMAHDACEPAFAKRHTQERELLAYVAAWCKLRTGDRGAVEDLAVCAGSVPAGGQRGPVARAARLDVANLLADYSGSVAALAMLRRHALDTPDMLDALAASYIALGDHDEGFAVGTQVAFAYQEEPMARRCERLLTWSDLGTPYLRDNLLAMPDDAGDCAKRARALGCAFIAAHSLDAAFGTRLVAMRECFAAFPDDPARESRLVVMLVYASWGDQSSAAWETLAREAETAADLPAAAAALARAARENGARRCRIDPACEH